MVCCCCSFLQGGVGRDHFTRNEIFADAEMFERALRLRAPQLVGGNIDLAETIGFFPIVRFVFGFCCHCFNSFTYCVLPLREANSMNEHVKANRPSYVTPWDDSDVRRQNETLS